MLPLVKDIEQVGFFTVLISIQAPFLSFCELTEHNLLVDMLVLCLTGLQRVQMTLTLFMLCVDYTVTSVFANNSNLQTDV